MDTSQDSIYTLTNKLIYLQEMEVSTVGSLRYDFKQVKAALEKAQSPYKAEKAAIVEALCSLMLATGRPNIKHDLFTLSAFWREVWDKDQLRKLLADIPALHDCVSQVPGHMLRPKD